MSSHGNNEVLAPIASAIDEAIALRGYSARATTAADEDFLFSLYCTTRSAELSAWGWDAASAEQFLIMQYKAQWMSYGHQYPAAISIILETDGAPIGRLVVDEAAKNVRLVDIALLPQYQRKGIGTCLLNALKDAAVSRQIPLYLSVQPGNLAVALYRRLGFIENHSDGLYMGMSWSAAFEH